MMNNVSYDDQVRRAFAFCRLRFGVLNGKVILVVDKVQIK
jgi:hypothetical protein